MDKADRNKTGFGLWLKMIGVLSILSFLFIIIKVIVFKTREETLFSRSMITMVLMAVSTLIMALYSRKSALPFSLFPKRFSVVYIMASVLALAFYLVTLLIVKEFSWVGLLMLLYSSMMTPVFEELLFRGLIWNRLSSFMGKLKTYIWVTVLFGLWHVGYAIGLFIWRGGNLFQIIAMKVLIGAGFGILTGALRYKTDNCYLGILIHGIFNAL